MNVCTFNVNSVRARLALLLQWLAVRGTDGATEIDVLCLQEIKTVETGFPFAEFQALGYHCEVFGQKAYNGVAICSRHDVSDVRKGFGDAAWDAQSRIIAATIAGVRVINIYAPHGDVRGSEKFNYKIGWYKRLLAYLTEERNTTEGIVMVGDFNVARADMDVFDPDVFTDAVIAMPEERTALDEVLALGFTDAFRYLYPQRQQFTQWDYAGGAFWKNQGVRIDYVCITGALIPALRGVETDLWSRKRRPPSDHAPVVATLDLYV
ncbi:MAG: exodeoxyribonuclease III [Candidatus Magnetobacterium sp. LHC-1]|uniref:Exodeoxyribonuclease III n=1 Tax=Candidatus Magnetobacterium casense TaxID=1455061 RepID=A0ABS6RYQ7_9BACT|nr:exodeoxyribonuclease III [Candidatus Magnetobacterium casensis]MBF0606019.1 exodeoxyribonuclease III [Nitrospirota bacterium]MBV6340923.1 exodeoxyribonuclease III [Candidatus Magnetobacterium casensis]